MTRERSTKGSVCASETEWKTLRRAAAVLGQPVRTFIREQALTNAELILDDETDERLPEVELVQHMTGEMRR